MPIGKIVVFFLLIGLFTIGSVSAQKSKAQLEREKKETLQKIKDAEKILNETATEKKANIGQLNAISNQIQEQQKLISSIQGEVNLLDAQIGEINNIVEAMEQDLTRLKEEYAAMIYAAHKSNQTMDKLSFLFTARTFNQLVMRMKYMEQYANARRNQVAQIERVKNALDQQRVAIRDKKQERNRLLSDQLKESENLLALKSKQSEVIKGLSQRETEIRKDLANRKKSVDNLEKLIADLVRKEIEKSIAEQKAREAAERKKAEATASKSKDKKPTTTTTSTAKIALTPETEVLSSSFATSKGKLPWPVASGFVTGKFGTHPHAVLKNIMVPNDGIDIQTNQNEPVRVVYDGVVTAISFAPGYNNIVMVQHGEYFTVYVRLKEVNVKTGQQVKAKDIIGTVYTNKEGTSELQFQIWKNVEKQNPQPWLVSR